MALSCVHTYINMYNKSNTQVTTPVLYVVRSTFHLIEFIRKLLSGTVRYRTTVVPYKI